MTVKVPVLSNSPTPAPDPYPVGEVVASDDPMECTMFSGSPSAAARMYRHFSLQSEW